MVLYFNKFHMPYLSKIAKNNETDNVKLLQQFCLAIGSLFFLALTVIILAVFFKKLEVKASLYWLIAPQGVFFLYSLLFKSQEIVKILEIFRRGGEQ
ncbi:hypothetical protein NITGR_430025 [Nitrospina gracilis 3/211]|uniref:Uncharacterized protein n=2 Tax=Nitrospinaceae TaxID=407032 RepID=M1ZC50_NITG3|nr:hypothetical protein NITGR_430025 [Nitrospina gracilis 3/211]